MEQLKGLGLRCDKVWGPEAKGTEKKHTHTHTQTLTWMAQRQRQGQEARQKKGERMPNNKITQCAVPSCKTGPDSKSHTDFYRIIGLRCGKVWQGEARNAKMQR